MAGITKPTKQLIPNAQYADMANMANKLSGKSLEEILIKAQRDAQKRWETEPLWADFNRPSIAIRMDTKEIANGEPRYGKWVKKNDTVTMDFKGKQIGNLNIPHIAMKTDKTTFDAPSTFTNEYMQSQYDQIANQDGIIASPSTMPSGYYAQSLFSFNILQELKNKGIIPLSWDINNLKNNIQRMEWSVVCYGTGSSNGTLTYGATVKAWQPFSGGGAGAWGSIKTNTSTIPTALITSGSRSVNIHNYVDSNGFIHILVHSTYPSDGTIPSTVYIDYIYFKITVEQWILEEHGIFVEEGTTNILTENQSSVEIDTTGFSGLNGATIERTTLEKWHGEASLKVTCPGLDAAERVIISKSCSPNTIYTASAYVKGPVGKTVLLLLREKDATNAIISEKTQWLTLTGDWDRGSVTHTFGANGVNLEFHVRNGTAEEKVYYIDGLQIEAKPYATSWILGGTTRQPEILTIPSIGLSPKEGCIRQWVYINQMAKRKIQNQYNRLFEIQNKNGGYSMACWHEPTLNSWRFVIRDDFNLASGGNISDSFTPDGWHLFEYAISEQEACVRIDGVKRLSISSPKLPSIFDESIVIGSTISAQHYLNTIFGQVQILNYFPSDEESFVAYNQGINGLTWNEHTIALYNWNNTLTSAPTALTPFIQDIAQAVVDSDINNMMMAQQIVDQELDSMMMAQQLTDIELAILEMKSK